MKFNDLDSKMRAFETAHDYCVLPGLHMVARLDGRAFTRMTHEVQKFETPYDERFRDYMVDTAEHLMQCSANIIYASTHSDEISLLFHPDDITFGRKMRKLNSILAGEASAKFSLLLGSVVSFDCRISQLPRIDQVGDYFRWRQTDAHRNALNSHCYWLLRKQGKSAQATTKAMQGMTVADKNELLFQNGINFNELPTWQKRGVGLYWQEYEKTGHNPITGEDVIALRRRITRDMNLPMKDTYTEFILKLLSEATTAQA